MVCGHGMRAMKTAKDLFIHHLDMLSNVAKGKGLLLVDVLPFLMGDPATGNFGVHDPRKDKHAAIRLQGLIERYRPVFYEQQLDLMLKEPRINLFDLPKETLVEWDNAIKDAKEFHARQSVIAKNKRPRKNEDGESLDDVVRRLAKNHPGEKPSELWPHLKTEIGEWAGCDCTETKPNENQDQWHYKFKIGEKSDTITFSSFRKKLKQYKTGF